MRRRESRRPCRSSFALWLDAVNCGDPEWLAFAGSARFDPQLALERWRAWPGRSDHALWWAK